MKLTWNKTDSNFSGSLRFPALGLTYTITIEPENRDGTVRWETHVEKALNHLFAERTLSPALISRV